LQAQKARVKKLMASFADSEDTTLQAALQEMLSDCTKEIADLKKDLEQKKRELYSLENTDTGNKLHELISLKEKLSDTETRRQARNIIRDIVDRIEVYPSGLSVENTDEHGAPDRKLRFYKIKFKGLNVTYKVLMPGPDSTYILTASPK
jgi:Zn-dependent oligopeptidase